MNVKNFKTFMNESDETNESWFPSESVQELKNAGYTVTVSPESVNISMDWSIDVDEINDDADLERPVYADVEILLLNNPETGVMSWKAVVSAHHKETTWTFEKSAEGDGLETDDDLSPTWICDIISEIISDVANDQEILGDLQTFLGGPDDDDEYADEDAEDEDAE